MEMHITETIVRLLKEQHRSISFAESLTGGLIASTLVSVSGASEVFGYGFVTYSDEAKHCLLGVDQQILNEHGSVSPQCAAAMAKGALSRSGADIALSVTGFAGPADPKDYHPVGTVFMGLACRKTQLVKELHFTGSRNEIRTRTMEEAFAALLDFLRSDNRTP